MSENALIVGSRGVIGKQIVDKLLNLGYAVTLLSTGKNNNRYADHKKLTNVCFDFENENFASSVSTAYDYLVIDGESTEFSGAFLEKIVSKIVNNIVIKKKYIFISHSSISADNVHLEKPKSMFEAENLVKKQGVSYIVFKPSLFMELLQFFVRGNQATLIKDQKHAVHWISGTEAANYLLKCMLNENIANKTIYAYGPDKCNFEEALSLLKLLKKPELRFDKISLSMYKSFATFSNNQQLLNVAEIIEFYSSFRENGNYTYETDAQLFQGKITLETWINENMVNST